MNNPNDLSRFDGSMDQIAQDELIRSFETGVLPRDFPQRLERLKKASGLTWRGMARANGIDYKILLRWRKGTAPNGGSMLSLFLFANRVHGGLRILLGEGVQMTFSRS